MSLWIRIKCPETASYLNSQAIYIKRGSGKLGLIIQKITLGMAKVLI